MMSKPICFFALSAAFLLTGCARSSPAPTNLPPTAIPSEEAEADPRRYQHGIDFVPLPNGAYALIWASDGNPPTIQASSENWNHDIYYAYLEAEAPAIRPVMLISNPEAQEPASAAISADGHILITLEDGWNTEREVAQRYGVYDAQLQPVLPYPQLVADGGHSGHVAAAGNHFVIFYSDGWVEGGGVDELGSGDDVLAAVYDSKGTLEYTLDIATGGRSRDWWPLAAGSPEHALLVWQRFVDDETYSQLRFSLLEVDTASLTVDAALLEEQVRYYTYSVAFIRSIDRFLLTGAYPAHGGFAYLIDTDGNVVAGNTNLPAPVREAQIIVRDTGPETLAAQAVAPSGLMVLALSPEHIELQYLLEDDYTWQYSGIDGIFLTPARIYLVATSPNGLVEKTFVLPEEKTSQPTFSARPKR